MGVLETVFQVYVVPKNLTTEKFLDIIITHTANVHFQTEQTLFDKRENLS